MRGYIGLKDRLPAAGPSLPRLRLAEPARPCLGGRENTTDSREAAHRVTYHPILAVSYLRTLKGCCLGST